MNNLKSINARVVGGGRYLSACCPYCIDNGKTEDTKYHLRISVNEWVYCYRCGFKSSYNWFSSRHHINIIDGELIREERQDDVFNLDEYILNNTIPTFRLRENNISIVTDYNSNYVNGAVNYLKKRKIDEIVISNLDIRIGDNNLFGRVVFIDEINKYFVGRSFLPVIKPKTFNPPSLIRPLMYFNMHKKEHIHTLYLVEGIFDMIPFIKSGKDVCALLGKDISPHQIIMLSSTDIDNVVVCLDPEANLESHKLVDKISSHVPNINVGVVEYKTTNGRDPSDYDISLFDNINILWMRILNNEYRIA